MRCVVVEPKTNKFERRDDVQLGFYVALVDEHLRMPELHVTTVGILLVADKNETVMKYSPACATQPAAVGRNEMSPADQAALTGIATEAAESN